MKKDLIADHLKHSLLFQEVSQANLEKFADSCRVQIVPEGDYVYRQGDVSEAFYVIAQGEVELIMEREDGSSKVVGRISQGGHLGETGLLTKKTRSVSAKALFDLVLITYERRIFRSVLLGNPLIHKQLVAVLSERLRVAWLDQAESANSGGSQDRSSIDDVILFKDKNISQIKLRRLEKRRKNIINESRTALEAQNVISKFSQNNDPFILTGESGTGKQIIARQIHAESDRSGGPYVEIDLREHDPILLEKMLFGTEQSNYPYAQVRQAGIFERACGGTIVFLHIRLMPHDLQRKIVRVIQSSTYTHVDSDRPIGMQSRIGFISVFDLDHLENSERIVPELMDLFRLQTFRVPSVRERKRDLPRLIEHYLNRFNREFGKSIKSVSPETLGNLMNYDWPGNLTELSGVMRRAVMLAMKDEILADHIMLGLPKSEGKWEFNILRFPLVKKFFTSKYFPGIPQAFVGFVLAVTLLALFIGPNEPDKNFGVIMSWSIGWPLMFFSFFFLARTWCSVCTLAMPGKHLQNLVKPKRNTPAFIKRNSGWLMAILCIAVMWVEIVWDAYRNPYLTAWIILAVSIGSCICSVLYSRRAWCRYLCPLGAVNAIFSMPSVLELRSNRHVCLNRCQEHSCFGGGEVKGGCPMFRHPYLVDNNRDCIICGDCIKNCTNSSIHLNLRLAPQELWSLETPRRADSFLIVALGAMFFPFALHETFGDISLSLTEKIAGYGVGVPVWLSATLIFFALILIFQAGYYLMVHVQAWRAKMDQEFLLPMLGYGFIPLILGGYLAVHFEMFVDGAWRIVPVIKQSLEFEANFQGSRLLSHDSTYVLQLFSVVGGLLASMYATYRIIDRIQTDGPVNPRSLIVPMSFLVGMGALFVFMV
ncbi:sigma 54-interacting transcriptional regulator [Desulfopila sp. IMCC35008]|uniref:sigma 54-interacting transcriptional regulator n=1 Tax=Desulfopila sp. IMCC35008 TaxID=2653858 RepID=UPI0013D6E105|nr:sigma 54-interacting transcriptional regulator [Desulfopila sp. IMCC35008]